MSRGNTSLQMATFDIEDPASIQRLVHLELAPFLREKVNPGAAQRDLEFAALPREVFEFAGELGLCAWLAPTSAGGLGGSPASFVRLLAELGKVSEEMEFPSLLSMYADLANLLAQCDSPAVRERYAQPALCGELLLTFAYTEETDSYDFGTRARRVSDGWLLSGHKVAQTGGALADAFLVYARDEADLLQVFVVDRNAPGVTVRPMRTIGFRSAGMTSLDMEEVPVPAAHVIVNVDGHGQVQRFLNARRLYVCAAWPARMRVLLDTLISFLDGRIRSGRPLSRLEAVQAHLGELFVHCEIAESVLMRALHHLDQGDSPVFDATLSATKYILAEHANQFAQRCMRLTGWPGFTLELPFQRAVRDFMGALSGQTPQEVMKILLGNHAVAQVELRRFRTQDTGRKPS